MKKLELNSAAFTEILSAFEKDLEVRNYSASIIYNMPNHINEFLHYLEAKGYENLNYVTTKIVTGYYEYLSTRKNATQGGALSNASLNKHQQALKLFMKYIKNAGFRLTFGVHLKYEKVNRIDKKDILTQDEIKLVFEACNYSHVSEEFRLRDKAILAILYTCGLRRNEAVGLNVFDVDFQNNRIYVRRGSKNKKREKPYVGINDFNLNILKNYLNKSRPRFDIYHKTNALFVNKNGTRMLGKTFADRLKAIIKATENEEIQEKKITPHNLRHSVATHLLQNGLSIEKVSKFLGHRKLESTQIYLHLADLDEDE